MITLLVLPAELAAGEVEVAGDAYRHLFRARRLAAGERVRVTDGAGRARWGEVARVERARATLVLGGAAPANEPPLRLELLVATLRPERAAWLVEKATELGVAAVRFVHSERAPREPGAGALDRLRRVAAAALEQSHGSLLPELSGAHPWAEVPALGGGDRWVLDTETEAGGPGYDGVERRARVLWGAEARSEAPVPAAVEPAFPARGNCLAPALPGRRAALLAGPEGGWTSAERRTLAAAGWRPAGLGCRTLRTETAAIAGAALLLLAAPPPLR
jgi:16S rRNA (uracil1498-N3)-methyltransferase